MIQKAARQRDFANPIACAYHWGMWLAPTPHFTAQLTGAPTGRAQIPHTLRLMRQAVDRGRTRPAILQAASSIIWLTPSRDHVAECAALFNYVQSMIRYQQDVYGVETLASPEVTLARRVGDCDDMSTLLCALFESVGYPTRFVAAGYQSPGDFEHVYCQVCIDGQWIDCDPTEPEPMGYAPPGAVSLMVF